MLVFHLNSKRIWSFPFTQITDPATLLLHAIRAPLTDPEGSCTTYDQSPKFVHISQLLALPHWFPVGARIKMKT